MHAVAQRASQRPEWLRVDRVLGEWGLQQDNAAGRRQFQTVMEERRRQEMSKEGLQWKPLRRRWCWGQKEFQEELLERIGAKKGAQQHGEWSCSINTLWDHEPRIKSMSMIKSKNPLTG